MTEVARPAVDIGLLTPEHLATLDNGMRAELLAQAFIETFEKEKTRAAYGDDLFLWFAFCREAGLNPLTDPRPIHAGLWLRWLASPPPGVYWPTRKPGVALKPVEPSSPRSIARRVSPVSNWYEWLNANEYSDRLPFIGVKRPKVNKAAMHGVALSAEQAAAMLDAALTDTDGRANQARNAAAMSILIGNGIRGGELVAIGVGDIIVHERQRMLLVRAGKNDKDRVLPLHAQTLVAIDAWLRVRVGPKGGPLLTTDTGKALEHKAVWRLVRRCARLAAKNRPELEMHHIATMIAPHDTRRTYITVALDNKANIEHVARDAGHGSTAVTQIYDQHRGIVDRSVAIDVGDLIASKRLHPPAEPATEWELRGPAHAAP